MVGQRLGRRSERGSLGQPLTDERARRAALARPRDRSAVRRPARSTSRRPVELTAVAPRTSSPSENRSRTCGENHDVSLASALRGDRHLVGGVAVTEVDDSDVRVVVEVPQHRQHRVPADRETREVRVESRRAHSKMTGERGSLPERDRPSVHPEHPCPQPPVLPAGSRQRSVQLVTHRHAQGRLVAERRDRRDIVEHGVRPWVVALPTDVHGPKSLLETTRLPTHPRTVFDGTRHDVAQPGRRSRPANDRW